MNSEKTPRLSHRVAALLFSSKGFAGGGFFLIGLYALAQIAGWREHVTFLTGTPGAVDGSWQFSVRIGIVYLLLHYSAVIVAPILLMTACVWPGLRRIKPFCTAPGTCSSDGRKGTPKQEVA